ncbi:MAG TPA: hypothetical protein VEA18_02955, partial [Candidatus Kapabacteria bacterium]|nr:hypothetical protein [Candidatus Kapabacteria bacterium]
WHVCRLLSVPTEGNKGKDPQDPPPNNALIIGHSPFVPMATWLTYDCPRIERFPDWFWEIEEMGGVHIQTTGKRGKDAFRFTRRIQPARRG